MEAYAGTNGGGEVGGMSMEWISVKDRLPELPKEDERSV